MLIVDGKSESLVILVEECSEVIQAISKIHRWGPSSDNNGNNLLTNIDHLIVELGDLTAMIDIVANQLGIDPQLIKHHAQLKKIKLHQNSKHLTHYTTTDV